MTLVDLNSCCSQISRRIAVKPCTALDLMWYYLDAQSELHTLRGFAVNGVQAIMVSFNCEIVSQNDVIGEHLFLFLGAV